jgi:hypothetical protein
VRGGGGGGGGGRYRARLVALLDLHNSTSLFLYMNCPFSYISKMISYDHACFTVVRYVIPNHISKISGESHLLATFLHYTGVSSCTADL